MSENYPKKNKWKSLQKREWLFQKEWKSLQKGEFYYFGELREGQLKTKELSLYELPKEVKFTHLEWFSLFLEKSRSNFRVIFIHFRSNFHSFRVVFMLFNNFHSFKSDHFILFTLRD